MSGLYFELILSIYAMLLLATGHFMSTVFQQPSAHKQQQAHTHSHTLGCISYSHMIASTM